MTAPEMVQLARQRKAAGDLAGAEKLYRQLIREFPQDPAGPAGLASMFCDAGHWPEALAPFLQVVSLLPNSGAAHHNLGNVYRALGKLDQAIGELNRAIQLQPDFAESHYMLGNLFYALGRLPESAACLARAAALRPGQPEIYSNLAAALCGIGKFDQGIAAYQQAVRLAPDRSDLHNNLAAALYRRNDLDGAEAAARKAIELNPHFVGAWANLASIVQGAGRLADALAAFDRVLELNPRDHAAASSRLMALQLHPASDSQRLLAEAKRWNDSYAAPIVPLPPAPPRSLETLGRRLRIGYVSPDFRDQVVGRNVLPLLRNHNRAEFEIFCYSAVAMPDAVTRQFREAADHWRDIARTPDAQAAQMIRADDVDLLVDLSLHGPENRLLVFAYKSSPIQITFAGYPGGTGLAAMDWRLTDPSLDPPGQTDGAYVERSHRLPASFWCYEASAMQAEGLEVAPLPAQANGHITFGCLNSFCKINSRIIPLWRRVLESVPNSRLMILAPPGSAHRRFLDALQVDRARIEFIPHQPRRAYLATFGRIDISLDTLPYNGHTTSLESMWMGAPVVSLVGATSVGRAGVSQLTNLGLTEWIAASDDQYVAKAAQFAADLAGLAEIRRTLRDRMRQSVLCDGKQFAHDVEQAYREIARVSLPSR